MIIGFGFGSPLTALLMLIVTGFVSYYISKLFREWRKQNGTRPYHNDQFQIEEDFRNSRRAYYYEQRDKAREMINKYDLTDEEIERIIEEEAKRNLL